MKGVKASHSERAKMSQAKRQVRRFLLGLVAVALVTTAVILGAKPVDAGGMGGIAVRPVRVCLNGVRFTGTATDPAALNRKMTARIFRGHVGVPVNLAATGNTTVFTAVGQTRSFAIFYPTTTFTLGEPVTYSVLTSDGSGYGGGQFGYVQKCYVWFW
jgi:hypothetical protein